MKTVFIAIAYMILAAAYGLCGGLDAQTDQTLPPDLKANVQQLIEIGVDEDKVIALTQAMLQHRFEAKQIIQAQEVISKSHQLGLPTDPLVNKAFEGMSKNVPADTIVLALEHVRSRYAFAYSEVGQITQTQAQTTQLGNLLAGSLAAGIGREDARTIIASLNARSQARGSAPSTQLARAGLSMVRDIARLGVSSPTATAVVVQALANNLSAKDMAALHASFVAQSKQTPPEQLAKNYAQAISSGKGVQSLGQRGGPQTGHQGAPAGAGDGAGSGGGAGGGAGGGGAGGAGGGGGGAGGAGGAGGGGGAGSGR